MNSWAEIAVQQEKNMDRIGKVCFNIVMLAIMLLRNSFSITELQICSVLLSREMRVTGDQFSQCNSGPNIIKTIQVFSY